MAINLLVFRGTTADPQVGFLVQKLFETADQLSATGLDKYLNSGSPPDPRL
jgi:hypothetical protein